VLVLTFAMLATGLDLVTSFSSVLSSVNNLGPALGEVGPATNFSGLTDTQTWITTVAMIVGRLEIFSVLVLFTATFWRK
jgi:trk system potassium uptake protein